MKYPNPDIIEQALKDLSIRYDIPELLGCIGLSRNDKSALHTEDIPFSVRGQFAAIVKSATVKAVSYLRSDFVYYLTLNFRYEHPSGSNGYSREFKVVCGRTFDEPKYLGVVESEVYYGIEAELVSITQKLNKK